MFISGSKFVSERRFSDVMPEFGHAIAGVAGVTTHEVEVVTPASGIYCPIFGIFLATLFRKNFPTILFPLIVETAAVISRPETNQWFPAMLKAPSPIPHKTFIPLSTRPFVVSHTTPVVVSIPWEIIPGITSSHHSSMAERYEAKKASLSSFDSKFNVLLKNFIPVRLSSIDTFATSLRTNTIVSRSVSWIDPWIFSLLATFQVRSLRSSKILQLVSFHLCFPSP